MLESIHYPITLKSSLSGGILESICAMDCNQFVKATFLQVTSIVLLYCLVDSATEW